MSGRKRSGARASGTESGWAATSTEVLGEDSVGGEGGHEPLGLLAHVGPDDGAKVLDQLLGPPVYLVLVAVDLVLGVAAPAPPLALGAAEFDVPGPSPCSCQLTGCTRIESQFGQHCMPFADCFLLWKPMRSFASTGVRPPVPREAA